MGKCCSNGVVVSQLSPARNTRLTLSVKLAYWVAISDFPLACHFCLSLRVCVATSAAPRPCRPFWYIHSSWIATELAWGGLTHSLISCTEPLPGQFLSASRRMCCHQCSTKAMRAFLVHSLQLDYY